MKLIRIDFSEPIEDLNVRVKYIPVSSMDDLQNRISSTFGNKIFVFDLSAAAVVDTTLIRYSGIIQRGQVTRMMNNYKIRISQNLNLGMMFDPEVNYDLPQLKKILGNQLIREAEELLPYFKFDNI